MLHRLYVDDRKDEQPSIGVGARRGNVLLATLLGVQILANQDADLAAQLALGFALTVLYLLDFVRGPERAIVGYKGSRHVQGIGVIPPSTPPPVVPASPNVILASSHVIPASSHVIPASSHVIPADAGIHSVRHAAPETTDEAPGCP